ncbi:DNA adenine methylase [Helicobacter suis]|uniref:DNA adenine methylase n=1 Tax=Helicobacter suis TaxID=104628 RepID=UPI00248FA838|nr:Dam family site-specific DNA-(adenine-N6)-methyltransferase [Helicobacter suis]
MLRSPQKIRVLPLKIQGIKSKIVPYIKELFRAWDMSGIYYEPFMGSGVVGFNLSPKIAVFSDSNPHIIDFYNAIKRGDLTKDSARAFLIQEGKNLGKEGQEYYLKVRQKFNKGQNSHDFLFLNRSCFNGLMRFNSKGGFNVPYCKKDHRFTPAYITKITNQIEWVSRRIAQNDYTFLCCDFTQIFKKARGGDFTYCDPPYIGRHADYFSSWSYTHEEKLHDLLKHTQASFLLSTWHSNAYRQNPYTHHYQEYQIKLLDHFYYLGGREENRSAVKEALIQSKNF